MRFFTRDQFAVAFPHRHTVKPVTGFYRSPRFRFELRNEIIGSCFSAVRVGPNARELRELDKRNDNLRLDSGFVALGDCENFPRRQAVEFIGRKAKVIAGRCPPFEPVYV